MDDTGLNTKEEKIQKAYVLAFEYEQKYGGCSQCVLAAIDDVLDIIDDETFKAAHSLVAGCALTSSGTCGALSGGLMAISSVYGRDRQNFSTGLNVQIYKKSYKIGKVLIERFKTEFDSLQCACIQTQLMGKSFNLWDRSEYLAFEEAGGHNDKCPSVTGKVAAWTVELLIDAEDNARSSDK